MMNSIIVILGGICLTLQELYYQKKLREQAQCFETYGNFVDLSDLFDLRCRSILTRYSKREISVSQYRNEIEEIYKHFSDHPYDIYKEKYRRDLTELPFYVIQQYNGRIQKIKSLYVEFTNFSPKGWNKYDL